MAAPGDDGPLDTHIHVASDDETRFPKSPTGIGSDWFVRGGFDAEAVLEALGRHGVQQLVAVQAAGVYGDDNRYVLDVAARHPVATRAVIAVDLDRPGAGEAIGTLARRPGVAGVRCMAVRPGSAWVGTPRAEAAFVAARSAGLVVVLTVFSSQLPALRGLLERFGDVPVVLDHCGFCQMEGGRPAGTDPLASLADLDQVHVKVTSHNLVHLASADERRVFGSWLAATFGTNRLVWGSDFPQTAPEHYEELLALADEATPELGPAERRAVMGGNGRRVFGFGPARSAQD